MKITIHWFRRDLRLEDNTSLNAALQSGLPVLLLFIFDRQILDELPKDDARIGFIYRELLKINQQLRKFNTSILCIHGNPVEVWQKLLDQYEVQKVYANRDYEPYARQRDDKAGSLLKHRGIEFKLFKDQVIFEENEIVKEDGNPYTVFTPFKKKWLSAYSKSRSKPASDANWKNLFNINIDFPALENLGFKPGTTEVGDYDLSMLDNYEAKRNYPFHNTSFLSPHLRFGTVSIRQIVSELTPQHGVFLSELIWREFFMQILYHYPQAVTQNFKSQYNGIAWLNNEAAFARWCKGETGFPMVDAGMRQLNQTGYMHNRVRMITASFLCKHLLIDWRWGEAYFAEKLLDYELSSNNGNWQWAAGTGCDAAPYFRIFNPAEQQKKFDPELKYITRWIPELGTPDYPSPMVDHRMARERAITAYKEGIKRQIPSA